MDNLPSITFVTFLNDFSGSPKVLSLLIKYFVEKGYKVHLITNRSNGFLSKLAGVEYHYIFYKWSDNRGLQIINFLFAQIQLFIMTLFMSRKNRIYYLNTITPIGAAFAAKFSRKKRIYHVHEDMMQQKTLYKFYRFAFKHCCTRAIFVSKYLLDRKVGLSESYLVYNTLDAEFIKKADQYHLNDNRDIILMVSSLKRYKGIYQFVELSKRLPNYKFEMVLSASEGEIEAFKGTVSIPSNLLIFSRQLDLHSFYKRTKILLSLSLPDGWIETFGLTILEAISSGIPCIVPNIGGPIEIIDDGMNGFCVDPYELDLIQSKINILFADDALYKQYSQNAYVKSKFFNLSLPLEDIEKIINI